MGLNRPSLEIRMLFKCAKKPMSKSNISNLFHRYSIEDREQALENLISDKLIEMKEMPRPDTKKPPVFYFISDAGKEWLKQYEASYPS